MESSCRSGLRDIIPACRAVSALDLDVPPKTAWSRPGVCGSPANHSQQNTILTSEVPAHGHDYRWRTRRTNAD
jgi:hypothetical protein